MPATVQVKRSFEPVVDPETRLLVLGSLPGEVSLAKAHYYAHPRNQFWLLMSIAVGRELADMPYEERLGALLRSGIGLWDVVGSASRNGSLDSNIRAPVPNALVELCLSLPKLAAIAFNGGKAAAIGRKQLAGLDLQLIGLPSSSPAFTQPFARKAERWGELKRWVETPHIC